jgi:hypothetical protein
MLVESKINGKKWLWVNIQKTATTSTLKTFFPEKEYNQQSHQIYVDLVRMYGYHSAFTMVRNPIDRFLSGINHLFSVCECKQCIIDVTRPTTTEEVILFLSDMLRLKHKTPNFFETVYKNSQNSLHLEVVNSIQKRFSRNIIVGDVQCIRWPVIIPQHYILHNATNIKIFKYEQIEQFFHFIETELGYIVVQEKFRNYTNKLSNVDVNNSTLRTLIYELHKEDFKLYGYDIC